MQMWNKTTHMKIPSEYGSQCSFLFRGILLRKRIQVWPLHLLAFVSTAIKLLRLLLSSTSISGELCCQVSALKIKAFLYPRYYSISGSTTSLTSKSPVFCSIHLADAEVLDTVLFCSGPQIAPNSAKSKSNSRVPGFTYLLVLFPLFTFWF